MYRAIFKCRLCSMEYEVEVTDDFGNELDAKGIIERYNNKTLYPCLIHKCTQGDLGIADLKGFELWKQ